MSTSSRVYTTVDCGGTTASGCLLASAPNAYCGWMTISAFSPTFIFMTACSRPSGKVSACDTASVIRVSAGIGVHGTVNGLAHDIIRGSKITKKSLDADWWCYAQRPVSMQGYTNRNTMPGVLVIEHAGSNGVIPHRLPSTAPSDGAIRPSWARVQRRTFLRDRFQLVALPSLIEHRAIHKPRGVAQLHLCAGIRLLRRSHRE